MKRLNRYTLYLLISAVLLCQATLAANKSTEQEIRLLVVHGILHLLGHDHADEATQKAMWEKQDAILGLMI